MMTGSPAAKSGAEKPRPTPNLKGTMVGLAPPDFSGALANAANPAESPAAKASNPNFKGTMVGVAPPGIEELNKQAAPPRAATQPAAPAAKSPPANLKGTMIGLAPPNMGAEVEAAKAKMAAKKAQAAEAQPVAQQASTGPAVGGASAVNKAPPSQLKGTMIGVAPPDVQAQLAAAKAAGKGAFTPPEEPPPEAPIQDNDPPSEPDPLGGTVVGTSPFAPGGPHALANPAGDGVDFNDETPPAGSGAPVGSPAAMAETSRLAAELAAAPAGFAPAPMTASAPEDPSPPYSPFGDPDPLPISKSSMGPVLIVVLLLLVVAAGVGFLIMGKGDAEDSEAGDEGAATEPASAP